MLDVFFSVTNDYQDYTTILVIVLQYLKSLNTVLWNQIFFSFRFLNRASQFWELSLVCARSNTSCTSFDTSII